MKKITVMETKWYLLSVKTHWEKKIAQTLTRKKIENYCPLNETSDNKNGQPLIPCHIFVKVTMESSEQIKKIPGVINFIYWLGKPALIKDSEINVIRRFLSECSNINVVKTSVNINETGKIINHSYTEQDGKVVAMESKTVTASLPSIGYALVAECEPSTVRVISSSKKSTSGANFIQRIRIASRQFAGYY